MGEPRASKACPQPACPHVIPPGGACPDHPRRPWAGRGTARDRGYDAEYERNRKRVLAEETHCARCGGPGRADDQAGHKMPRSEGGPNSRENLQREHRRCNQAEGASLGGRSSSRS